MADGALGGAIRAALEDLARRLELELPLRTAELWDGAWHALKDPGRVSLATPAALVSVTSFGIAQQAMSRWRPGQLRGVAAGDPPHHFPRPGQSDGDTRGDAARFPALVPHVRAEIAVTFLSAAPGASRRTAQVLDLVEAALPVLIGFGLEELAGSSLYTPALHAKGLAAFVVIGRRELEATPEPPDRLTPAHVDLIEGEGPCGDPEQVTVYTRGAA